MLSRSVLPRNGFVSLLSLGCLTVGLWGILGCGSKVENKDKEAVATAVAPEQPPAPASPAPVAPTGPTGTIRGRVTLTGQAPQMPLLRRGADPRCDNGEVKSETITVSADGGLANVLVRIKPGTVPAFTPSETLVVDQQDCLYRPHVQGGVRGQTVEMRNSDATTHNVHTRHLELGERKGRETLMNRAQPVGVAMTFELGDEPVVALKCDLHPWMSGYIVVSDNPYFSVSTADGSFVLPGVPVGTHSLEFWHEFYGMKTVEVTVTKDGTTDTTSSFDAVDDNPRKAK